MASLAGSTDAYERYVERVPQENQYKLKLELDADSAGMDLHLKQIAELLVDWELLAPNLGLTDADVDEIKSDNNKAALKK